VLKQRHIKAWKKRWNQADIRISGDEESQRAMRFNMFHLIAAGPVDHGKSSIGARTLSSEGYRGHIFWDTEIFIVPFFIYNFPEIARNLMLYRYNRLDAARHLARERGYKGAMFPWESADKGTESTPSWAKDLDGTIIKIHTEDLEHHITADIAYAFFHDYIATGDEKFLLKYCIEILLETARFW
jgi:kojibiose phosphorylase